MKAHASSNGYNLDEPSLNSLIVMLYGERWPARGYDLRLINALNGCIAALQSANFRAVGIRTHTFLRQPLSHFPDPRVSSQEIEQSFESKLTSFKSLCSNTPCPDHLAFFPLIKRMNVFVSFRLILRKNHMDDLTDEEKRQRCDMFGNVDAEGYVALFFVPIVEPQHANETVKAQWGHFCSIVVAPLLFDAFQHRERRMLPFSPAISKLYWDAANLVKGERKGANQTPIAPPWDDACLGSNAEYDEGRRGMRNSTVTLSVDLRKSTFCMDQAENKRKFGVWLDNLVKVITRVCHTHAGVFDKFTGDGGLLHFLERECNLSINKSAIVAAMECSLSLRSEIASLLPDLRSNLRNDSDLLGAGISLAVSDAYWAVDRQNSPIVVGHGVVDACRLCDGTPAASIRITNAAYQSLKKANANLALPFKRIELGKTKEQPDEMKVMVWEMSKD